MAMGIKMNHRVTSLKQKLEITIPMELSDRKAAFSDFTNHETAKFKNGDFYSNGATLDIDTIAYSYYGHRHDKGLPLDLLYNRPLTIKEKVELYYENYVYTR